MATQVQLWLAQLNEQSALLELMGEEEWKGNAMACLADCTKTMEEFEVFKKSIQNLMEDIDAIKEASVKKEDSGKKDAR